jgi:hypothetical protein
MSRLEWWDERLTDGYLVDEPTFDDLLTGQDAEEGEPLVSDSDVGSRAGTRRGEQSAQCGGIGGRIFTAVLVLSAISLVRGWLR